jgi:hypothetical protein
MLVILHGFKKWYLGEEAKQVFGPLTSREIPSQNRVRRVA